MISAGGNESRRRLPRWLIPALGYTISISCLIWVYYGFDWKKELPKLAATDWRWVTLAVAGDILVYVCQGWRWSVLLSPLSRVPVARSVQAVYIGLFANEVLPLRSGEVIRCYLVSRWSGLPFSVTLSSAVVERVIDGVWLVLGFYIIGMYVKLPGALVQGSRLLLLLLVGFGIILAWMILHKSHAHELASRSRWAGLLRHIVDGVHNMGNSRTFAASVSLSLLYLLIQAVPVYALMRGYGLGLRLGSVPPQAPSNVGSFQFFTILGLRLFGVGKAEATGFATLLFVVVTVPLWLGGFIALLATRMRLTEIRREARSQLEQPRPA